MSEPKEECPACAGYVEPDDDITDTSFWCDDCLEDLESYKLTCDFCGQKWDELDIEFDEENGVDICPDCLERET